MFRRHNAYHHTGKNSPASLCCPILGWLFLFLFVNNNNIVRIDAVEYCNLCGDGRYPTRKDQILVDGRKCALKFMDMLQLSSNECATEIGKHRECCCGSTDAACEPPGEIPEVEYIGPIGNYPSCDICKGRGPPAETSMVINILYLQAGTCTDYYQLGLHGNFGPQHCDPLRLYAYEPCGCGRNTNTQALGTSANSPISTPTSNSIPSQTNPVEKIRRQPPPDSRPKLSDSRGGAGGGRVPPLRRYLKGVAEVIS